MKISEHIQKKKLTRSGAASDLDISEAHLSRLITGERKASGPLAARIITWSKGKIKLEDLFGDSA